MYFTNAKKCAQILKGSKRFLFMKGIILHGGSGTRLRPLTYTDVKQLLPIAGKPISEYALENLIEIGIRKVNIVVGTVGGSEVKEYYGNGKKWGIDISYTFQEKPMGIAHAIGLTRSFVGNEDFVVMLGDNYLQNGISNLFDDYVANRYDGMLALVRVKNPTQFGVAEVRDSRIVKLVEKPKEPSSDLAIVGVYFLKPVVFDVISKLQPSKRGEYEITEAYQKMIDDGMNIGYSIVSGWFKDTGTLEDFLECNRLVLDKIKVNEGEVFQDLNVAGRVSVSPDVIISSNSRVLGPCFIGPGTRIESSYIGPYTSIGSNCTIRGAEVEDSIIMDRAAIELSSGIRIRQSLIGPSVTVYARDIQTRTLKLLLGRDSKVEL